MRSARIIACSGLILLAACASSRYLPDEDPPNNLRFGPEIELLRAKTVRDKVCAVADRSGNVHVIIASNTLHQVVEVTVPRGGQPSRRIVRTGAIPWSMDAAFDGDGHLHVLLDTDHHSFDGQAWKADPRTPWQAAGIKTRSARFVAGAPELTWSFAVDGTEVGSPHRMDIYGFGGYGGALVWPWITSGTHTVLVRESGAGFGPWLVLEPDSKMDSTISDAVSDRQGNVYVTYSLSRDGMAGSSTNRFAWIRAGWLRGSEIPPDSAIEGKPGPSVKLYAIDGQTIEDKSIVRRLTSGRPVVIPMPRDFIQGSTFLASDTGPVLQAVTLGRAHDEWTGQDFPVHYLRLAGNGWSGPVELGLANSSSFWGSAWTALDIASTGPNRAFVVWPKEDAIVGRWIECGR